MFVCKHSRRTQSQQMEHTTIHFNSFRYQIDAILKFCSCENRGLIILFTNKSHGIFSFISPENIEIIAKQSVLYCTICTCILGAMINKRVRALKLGRKKPCFQVISVLSGVFVQSFYIINCRSDNQ